MAEAGKSTDDVVPKAHHKLTSIQIMRGVAALWVAALHVYTVFLRPEYGGVIVFESIVSKGWIGVNLFFVISGFIIANAHSKDFDKPGRIPYYLWQRFTRLYPLYWILLTVFIIAASLGLGYFDFNLDPLNMFTAYSLLNVIDMPKLPLKVAWTLLFEVKFYVIFISFLISRRLGFILFSFWFVAILFRNAFEPIPDWGYVLPDWGMLHMWNTHFLLGVLAWFVTTRTESRYGLPILLMGFACLCILFMHLTTMGIDTRHPPTMLALAATFGLIVAGGVLSERHFRFSPPRLLLLLGDASYSVYLVHSAALSLLAAIYVKWFRDALPPAILYIGAGTIAVTAGVICHLILERPLLRFVRSHRPKRISS